MTLFLALINFLAVYSVSALFIHSNNERNRIGLIKRVFYSTGYGPGGMNIDNGVEEETNDKQMKPVNDLANSLECVKNLKSQIELIQTKIKNGKLSPPASLLDLLNKKVQELKDIAQKIKAGRGKRRIVNELLALF